LAGCQSVLQTVCGQVIAADSLMKIAWLSDFCVWRLGGGRWFIPPILSPDLVGLLYRDGDILYRDGRSSGIIDESILTELYLSFPWRLVNGINTVIVASFRLAFPTVTHIEDLRLTVSLFS